MTLYHRRSRTMSDTSAWNAITANQTPLADAEWIESFANAFEERPEIVTQYRDDKLVAGIALVKTDGLARVWTSLDNEHNPYFPIAGEPDARALLQHLLEDADCLYLRRLPVESAACKALREAARELRMPEAFIESDTGDTRIVLDGNWDALRARLPKNFQQDLPRKQRKLAKQGSLAMNVLEAPGPALDTALAASFDVEARSWKGTEGSPINRDPKTLAFYTNLARSLAARGRFALYTLELDGRVIAFEYCLRGGGHIEMLKLSFDPAYSSTSPGQVLRVMMLEREASRGEIRYYHLGRPSEWKRRWATEIEPLCTLRIYASTTRGRAAYMLGPVLRSRLKQSPLAMRARGRLIQLRDKLRGLGT